MPPRTVVSASLAPRTSSLRGAASPPAVRAGVGAVCPRLVGCARPSCAAPRKVGAVAGRRWAPSPGAAFRRHLAARAVRKLVVKSSKMLAFVTPALAGSDLVHVSHAFPIRSSAACFLNTLLRAS